MSKAYNSYNKVKLKIVIIYNNIIYVSKTEYIQSAKLNNKLSMKRINIVWYIEINICLDIYLLIAISK